MPQVKGDASLTFAPIAGLGFQQFMFQRGQRQARRRQSVQNKLVRQAFQYAIDRNAISEVAGGGIFDPAQQPFPPASPYHSDKFPPTKRDVAKARALLKQAGFERVKAEVMFGNNTTTSSIAEIVQAMASEAGFDLSLRPTEYAALQKESAGGNFQVVMLGWSGRVDPDGNIHAFVTCKGALNDGHYCNPEVDKLLNEARTVPDEAKRKAIYDQAQTIIQDELPGVYNCTNPGPSRWPRRSKGFTPYRTA